MTDKKAVAKATGNLDPAPKTATRNRNWFDKWLDTRFEGPFFALRYVTFVPVAFAFLGSLIMFGIGAVHSWRAVARILVDNGSVEEANAAAVQVPLSLIKAVDASLLGLVLLIFSYGIYDLFIRKLEPGERRGRRPSWMRVSSMGELKVTLAEVVLIILVITFFELVMSNIDTFLHVSNVWELLVVPLGVFLIACGVAVFEKVIRH